MENLDFANAITFEVDKVKVSDKKINSIKANAQMEKVFGHKIEACKDRNDQVIKLESFHSLIAAMHKAYNDHHPFALTPDIFWITIAQGFSAHVNKNAEQLRKIFVNHEGKKKIEIRRNAYKKGSPENNWEDVFPEFTDKIKDYIGDENHDLIVADFSTTSISDRCASEIVLMESMKSYFEYICRTLCGIPQISIFGTVEDWEKILEKVNSFDAFGLGFWTKRLKPICEELISASKGKPNREFFSNMYKLGGGSGGPYVSGWCTHLFPYTYERYSNFKNEDPIKINIMLEEEFGVIDRWGGLTHDVLPASFSKVPMDWDYFGRIYNMQIMGGVITASQDANGTIVPQTRWAVSDLTEDTKVHSEFIY